MSFSLAELFDRMDRLPENIVMGSMNEFYNTGRRGIFSDKFMPYSDVRAVGYTGFKRIVQSLFELDPSFVKQNSDELEDLLDAAQELLGRIQSGEVSEDAVEDRIINLKSQITNHEEGDLPDDTGIGQLDDQWGRDQYA